MEKKSPVEVLFSTYQRRILGLLLLHPERSYYVREIARLTGVPAGSAHRELKRLAESGLLHKEAVGNQVRYRADRDCPIFTELAGIFRKTSGLADVLRDSLAPLQNKIDLAFIFGSVAQGKERQTSDVDVLVIGEASLVDLVTAFAGGHERLGREINPVAMKSDDFVMKYATGERFVTRVMQEAKLFLIGDHDDLGKLVEDRTAEAPHD